MDQPYKIDRGLKIPLYHQIYQNILEMTENGHLAPGELLQPESVLAKLYGVNRLTLRQAFDQLERRGHITRRHGIGTFVASPVTTQLVQGRISFTQKMNQIGKTASSKLLSLQTVPAHEEVARNLHLELNTPVIELSRIRYADSEPIMHETAYLPAEQLPDLNQANLGESSLYAFLEKRYHIIIKAVEQTLQPILLTSRQASLLDVTPDTPAMLTRLVAYNQNNLPIEYSISITRGDKCHFYYRFREEEQKA